jgi:predicted acylesterase/phospholipase RssA
VSIPEAPVPQAPPASGSEVQKHVAVILGPGGAKALAEAGVLKAMQQQRLPVEKVIGLEWGALVAALYADKGQVHEVEWKLYKMQQAHLPRANGFFKSSNPTVRVMGDFLNDAFGKETVSASHVKFECPSRSLWTGTVVWQNRGSLKDAVRNCLPYPPVFRMQGSFIAGASQAREAIQKLASEGYNVIILVNVLGSAMPVSRDALLDNLNYVILWQEVKRAIAEASRFHVETIDVDTSAYPIMKFGAQRELIQLGEAAGNRAVSGLISKYGF